MARRRLVRQLWLATVMTLFSLFNVARAHAQPPPDDPNDNYPPQMCGNGEAFTVTLPGTTLGFDDKNGILNDIEAVDVAPSDEIVLPKGCRIYAFLISGWSDNKEYDHIIFYKFAEFVAQNNGYVHVGWWNNLGKEYLFSPLRNDTTITIRQFPCCDEDPMGATPSVDGFVLGSIYGQELFPWDVPKGNPDEDIQFVSDLTIVLRRLRQHIREENPGALIILAGHSMGAAALAHTVAAGDISVDLLALIDPVNNRDRPTVPLKLSVADQMALLNPIALLVNPVPPSVFKANWTRWRATHDFKGWKVRDCVRTDEPEGTGLCRNFGSFFFPSFKCTTRGAWLVEEPLPLFSSAQPILCPGSYEDPGPRVTIGPNVRHLYHRWQHEFLPPLDAVRTELFNRPSSMPLSTTNILSPNFQRAVETCSGADYDPRDDNYDCHPRDGHGELIGVRVKSDLNEDDAEVPDDNGRVRPGLKLTNWPQRSLITFTPGQRRDRLIQLAVDGPAWPYQPKNPDLCLVCDDLRTITLHLMGELPPPGTAGDALPPDTVPPTSHATPNPEANAQGWFNEDVVVSVSANDNRSVQEIHLTLSGAQAGTTTTPGGIAEATITAEGDTAVSYFARDASGNAESPHTLNIRIDKTAPVVNALTDVPPNLHGWTGSPVVVSFVASDEPGGSGIATSPPAVSKSTEGAKQEIVGTAEDNAGNSGAAVATLNIDLTPPEIVAIPDLPPNGNGWNNTDVRVSFEVSDALSGIASSTPDTVVSTEGVNQRIVGTATDRADHTASASVVLNIDKTAPTITATANIASNSHGWNSSDVVVSFAASDALSELASSPADVTVSNEGAGLTISGTAEDRAGNTASASLVVNLDKTAPAIALFSRTPANGAGWNNTDVNLVWNCSDALSGPVADQVSQLLTAEAAGQNALGTCADRAGHTAANTQSGINIDKTSPVNQIATPAQGAAYLLNAAVTTTYGCVDTLSGVTACAGPVASGAALDTSTVGAKTFTVNSLDAAGNPAVASHAYNVQYAFSGFSNPIATLPALNKVNAGRTVPVKYSLRDATGAVVPDLSSFTSLVSAPVACDTNAPTADAEETDATGSTTIQFDSGQFIYHWQTQSAWAGTCRVLQLTLMDGTQHTVAFQFR